MLHSNILVLSVVLIIIAASGLDAQSKLGRNKRNAFTNPAQQYANGKIKYNIPTTTFGGSKPINENQNQTVTKAMEFLSKRTCLQFEDQAAMAGRIVGVDTDPCSIETIGKSVQFDNVIYLSMNHSCSSSVPLIIRILMHGMGFYAMSARPDVDTYMTVNSRNVNNTHRFAAESVLLKQKKADLIDPLPPFEFGSILSYPPNYYSDMSRPTVTAKAPYEMFQYAMGSERVTFGDIKMINNLYCPSTCGSGSASCSNFGYPNPSNCKLCLCPEGYGGPKCTDLPTGVISDRTQGFKLMANATWQQRFIEFGQEKNAGIREEPMSRVDWIVAESGKKIEVMILDIYDQCNPGCKLAAVEIKNEFPYLAGPRLCCSDHTKKSIISSLNPTPLISYNRWFYTTFSVKYRTGKKSKK